MSTNDGFSWTPENGLQKGLPCIGVVEPVKSAENASGHDVAVIGAGFTGLVAARDLALRGLKVLLLDARDRIGGRAFTSVVEGYPYEVGAAWARWNQPHFLSQITRYRMKPDLKITFDTTGGVESTNINFQEVQEASLPAELSPEQDNLLHERAAEIYFDVDGALGRNLMPYPHLSVFNPDTEKWNQVTALDRIDQIRDQLTALEATSLTTYIHLVSGGAPENTRFLDLLRWWALCDYGPQQVGGYEAAYKLKCGTSGLARRIFEDGLSSTNLTVKLRSPVKKVQDLGNFVTVTTVDGTTYTSRKAVSTIPLNVLKSVEFEPRLSAEKTAAINIGHIGRHTKIHYEAAGPELRSWSGYAYPGKGLLYAYGDETTPKGNTHIVSFGSSTFPLNAEQDIEATKGALLHLRKDIDIRRILFHNWARDPYAQGSWAVYSTQITPKHLEALQTRHGNIWFASSDWADGWRGFMDGAIEQGITVAQDLVDSFQVK